MTTYTNRDLACSFEGDILLDGRGDLLLANSLDTYKGAANWVLRTDLGDYQADVEVGCNLGSFIGEHNIPKVHEAMEYSINKVLQNEIFSPTDASSIVVPFDTDEALAIINLAGYFLIDGEVTYVQDERWSYSFPFISASPTPLTL